MSDLPTNPPKNPSGVFCGLSGADVGFYIKMYIRWGDVPPEVARAWYVDSAHAAFDTQRIVREKLARESMTLGLVFNTQTRSIVCSDNERDWNISAITNIVEEMPAFCDAELFSAIEGEILGILVRTCATPTAIGAYGATRRNLMLARGIGESEVEQCSLRYQWTSILAVVLLLADTPTQLGTKVGIIREIGARVPPMPHFMAYLYLCSHASFIVPDSLVILCSAAMDSYQTQ